MKRLPRGTKAQIMGTRLFQTMYTADQMRKAVADEREACAVLVEKTICDTHIPTGINIYGTRAAKALRAVRARGNT
jgi:hypothetical protein